MPQINDYEVEITIRFAVVGPLSQAGAAKAAEERASKSLAADGPPPHDDPVKGARIISVAVEDTTVRPLHFRGTGGHR
jgi:hypothetical protein